MKQSITDQFNIGVATVMVGRPEDVLNLTPEVNSIGLIKNFSLTSETNEVTLTQGLRNTIVDSQVTSVTTQATFEVYEYTASNLAYAAGLDGANFSMRGEYKLGSAITGGTSATSIILSDVPSDYTLPAGTILAVQCSSEKMYDKVYLAKVASSESADSTVTVTLDSPIPAGWDFVEGDKVFVVNPIPVGSDEAQPYFGIKIVGVLPNGNEPFTLIFPKAKITSGLSINFTTDNYSSMPFEVTPYDLTSSDAMFDTFKKYNSNLIIYKGDRRTVSGE